MTIKNNTDSDIDDSEKIALELIINKNLWLTRIRWTYTFFILIFFSIYNSLSMEMHINFYNLFLILFLSAVGNIIFIFTLKKSRRRPLKELDYKTFSSVAGLQLDFDLVILSLLVFFSGGFESPVILLFIFYVMVSTFLIHPKKALQNTVTAMVLITLIFFENQGLAVSSPKITTLVAFNIILFFSFFISSFLAKNIRGNEKILQELLAKSRKLSVTDGLTGLYNQSYFFGCLKSHIAESKKQGLLFSIIIFDVDNFKNYNDYNGHIRGSEALAKIAGIMKDVFRGSDILAKYGGDEFVAILPRTDKVGAFLAADRLRETVEKETFVGGEHQPTGKITLSLGVAGFPEHGSTEEELLEKADRAMYFAKEAGRNKTVIYSAKLEETHQSGEG